MTRLAFDMSSYIKTGLLVGRDEKDGQTVMFDDRQVLVNSAEYGYENVINMMVKTINDCGVQPNDCILVFEGINSKSRRLLIDPQYKAKRDKRPPEFYEEFARLRDYIEQVWKDLGAIAMTQDYVEGDDVLSWLACESEEDIIIASRDGDLGVLNTEPGETNAYGATVRTYNDGRLGGPVMLDGEPFVHPFKYIHLYKALVGDTSDNIPGVHGFGKAAFQKLAETYGYDGLDDLIGCLAASNLEPLHELADEMNGKKPAHPLVKKIVEQEKDAIRSFKLAKLYPEWINTMARPISIRPGKVAPAPSDADSRLLQWYGESALVTAFNYKEACGFFQEQIAVSPDLVFDIETSTPQESDDWIANIPKKGKNGDMVDQLGSVLTGFSFTFGSNRQCTFYVSVDHAGTDNIKMSEAREFIELAIASGKPIVIHNNFFELSVLAMAEDEDGRKWVDLWKDLGARGFLPNVLDTKMEVSYADENFPNGLKFRSKHHLGYEQVTFEAVTTLEGRPEDLPAGGKLKEVLEWEQEQQVLREVQVGVAELPDGEYEPVMEERLMEGERIPTLVRRQYKMRELTAEHVMAYGCDDTICTAALHNFCKLVMQLEHTWQTYLDVEIDASYQHAKNFIDGVDFSLEKMLALEAEDDAIFDKAWTTVRAYLMKHGWEGTVPPVYGADISAAQIKEAYSIVMGADDEQDGEEEAADFEGEEGEELPEGAAVSGSSDGGADGEGADSRDHFLSTRTRTPRKLVVLLRELGHDTFAGMLEQCLDGEHEKFTAWVREHFSGEPKFKGGNKQMTKLLYEVMQLPIKVRNKPTAKMRAEGKEGNPKGDVLALDYAIRDGDAEQKAVLESLKLMQMVKTRRSFYYSKYPYMVHWKTGKLHSSHNQCQALTRRASESGPNKQQLPKAPKIVGTEAKFREVIVPHHPDAVIVSLDEDSQELRMIADYSWDTNMVACFIGENKKSLHSLTGHSIAVKKRKVEVTLTYEEFDKAAKDKNHPLHAVCLEHRVLGKKVNFTTEFGAMAPKLAMTMLCTEEEAQTYIDAKEAMFPGVRKWKNAVIEEMKRSGYVRTKMGAMRHFAAVMNGEDYWLKSKAERQAVNFKIQSSCAEMVKRAEGAVWRRGLVYKYDAVCYGPVHDELVFSVMKKDLLAFLQDAHACMVQPYGGMKIPIVSSISFGPSFGEQFEIGSEPTAEAVEFGWKQLAEKMAAKGT